MERLISFLTAATLVASLVSVAASSIFFGSALLLWLISALRRRVLFRAPPFTPFVLAYCGAVLLSVLFSEDPAGSVGYLPKLLRLAPVFLIFTFMQRRDLVLTLQGIAGLAACSAVYALLQYFWLIDVNLLNRIRGFMGHWMTFSGQMMIVLVALAGLVAFRPWAGERESPATGRGDWSRLGAIGVLMLLLGSALLLTFTRNAWLGCFVGLLVLLALFDWRWLIPFAGAAVLVFLLVLPEAFQARLMAGLDFRDTTNKGRVELLQTGLNMVRAHPLTGVGPRMVPRTAERYAPRYESGPEFPAWLYQHLHNTPLQVAAETGLIALAAWVGWWAFVAWDLLRRARRFGGDPLLRYLSMTALAVLAAFLTSGFLEYNFGDSELITLLLFFVTAPYAALRKTQAA